MECGSIGVLDCSKILKYQGLIVSITPLLHCSIAPLLLSFYNLSKLRAADFASPSLSVRPMPADETALSIRTETNEMVIAFEVEEVG